MFKNLLKGIIMFFIPFLFINSIYAEDNEENLMINYRYKTSDGDYIVTMEFNSKFDSKESSAVITKYSSESVGTEKPLEVANISNLFPNPNILLHYGITAGVDSFSQYDLYYDNEDIDFFAELKKNPDKYRPILKFDNNGNPILIGSFFVNSAFEETDVEGGSYNLNDWSDDTVEKLLNGSLNSKLIQMNFAEVLNIDNSVKTKFVESNINSINSSDQSYNSNFTSGTCEGYYKGLKEMREVITGKNVNNENVSGICSVSSLNAMQKVSSLYDLENNFDNSVLEPACREMIFGSNGYIKRILQAQTFYNNLKFKDEQKAYMISCLSMESEYLTGFTLLTTYSPNIEDSEKTGCELIDTRIIDFINDLFDVVKIACTALCIFLCISDVYKMIVTNENSIDKFKSSLIKRIVALVAVFLLPLFINIITDLINDRYLKSNPSKCSNIIRK